MKYLRSTTLGCKEIGIRKSESVATGKDSIPLQTMLVAKIVVAINFFFFNLNDTGVKVVGIR